MRRTVHTVIAASALTFAFAGVAAAEQEHHHRHHHHAAAHLVRVGSSTTVSGSGPTTTSQPAAKIASFSNGVLTLTLADGSSVSGKVTEMTRIECHPASVVASSARNDGQDNDIAGGGSSGSSHGDQGDNDQGDNDQGGNDQGDDNGEDAAEHCTSAALVAGAKVGEAELKLSSGVAVWQEINLIG